MYEDINPRKSTENNEEFESISESVIRLLQKIQNHEFKLRFFNSINEKTAFERKDEDCSYVVGVLTAIKDFSAELQKVGSLIVEDAKLINELYSLFEERGGIKLKPEVIFKLVEPIQKVLGLSVGSEQQLASMAKNPILFSVPTSHKTKQAPPAMIRVDNIVNESSSLKATVPGQ